MDATINMDPVEKKAEQEEGIYRPDANPYRKNSLFFLQPIFTIQSGHVLIDIVYTTVGGVQSLGLCP